MRLLSGRRKWALVLVAVAAGTAWRWAETSRDGGDAGAPPAPRPAAAGRSPFRDSPLCLKPGIAPGDVIPVTDLDKLLALFEPHWETRRAAELSHALRLWGPDVEFPPAAVFPVPHPSIRAPGTRELLGFFLDYRMFRDWHNSSLPYFFRSVYGVGASGSPPLRSPRPTRPATGRSSSAPG